MGFWERDPGIAESHNQVLLSPCGLLSPYREHGVVDDLLAASSVDSHRRSSPIPVGLAVLFPTLRNVSKPVPSLQPIRWTRPECGLDVGPVFESKSLPSLGCLDVCHDSFERHTISFELFDGPSNGIVISSAGVLSLARNALGGYPFTPIRHVISLCQGLLEDLLLPQ